MRFNGPAEKPKTPKAKPAQGPGLEDEAQRVIESMRMPQPALPPGNGNGHGKPTAIQENGDTSIPVEAGPAAPQSQFKNEVIKVSEATVLGRDYVAPSSRKTVSIDAAPLLPPGVNLNFADPKAAEWIRRAVPALGRIIEAMSIKPGGPGKPLLLYGFVGFMLCLGAGIAYSMTVQKWQDTNNDFQLNWLKLQIKAHNGTSGPIIPPSAAPQAPAAPGTTGALCVINPFNGPTNHC